MIEFQTLGLMPGQHADGAGLFEDVLRGGDGPRQRFGCVGKDQHAIG